MWSRVQPANNEGNENLIETSSISPLLSEVFRFVNGGLGHYGSGMVASNQGSFRMAYPATRIKALQNRKLFGGCYQPATETEAALGASAGPLNPCKDQNDFG